MQLPKPGLLDTNSSDEIVLPPNDDRKSIFYLIPN